MNVAKLNQRKYKEKHYDCLRKRFSSYTLSIESLYEFLCSGSDSYNKGLSLIGDNNPKLLYESFRKAAENYEIAADYNMNFNNPNQAFKYFFRANYCFKKALDFCLAETSQEELEFLKTRIKDTKQKKELARFKSARNVILKKRFSFGIYKRPLSRYYRQK